MQSIFNYESKFMQILLTLADMIILNILFVLCSLPIVTIGAAQAGLFSGIRQLMNKEDDRSPIPFFFKGFASGFWKVTLLHVFFLVIMALLGLNTAAVLVYHYTGATAPVWMCIAALCICAVYHSLMTVFHASFGCTIRQLLRNIFFVSLAHLLRAIVSAVLIWLPLFIAAIDLYSFMKLFLIWALLYYGIAFLFVYSIWKKPFNRLKENFLEAQKAQEAEAVQEIETAQEEATAE